MAASVSQLKDRLYITAEVTGAGANVLDDAVLRVIRNAASDTSKADVCKNMGFVDAAITDTAKLLVGGQQLTTARNAMRNAIRAVTCGGGTTTPALTKAQFVNKLDAHKPRDVVGYPVKANAASKMVTFRYKTSQYSEQLVEIPVDEVSTQRGAKLRLHSNGDLTFTGLDTAKLEVLKVKSVTRVQGHEGWANVQFEKNGKSYGTIPAKVPRTAASTARVFTKNGKAVHMLSFGATGPVAASPTVLPAVFPTDLIEGENSPDDYPGLVDAVATAVPVPVDDGPGGDAGANSTVDAVTGQATAEGAEGPELNITVRNENDGTNEGEAFGGVPGPGVAYPGGWYEPTGGLVAVPATDGGDNNEDTQPQPESCPPQPQPICPAPPPPPQCPTVEGLTNPGTFFCMTRRTFYIVVCMLIVASLLAGLGYYIYRKRGAGAGNGANLGGAANASVPGNGGFDDLQFGDTFGASRV